MTNLIAKYYLKVIDGQPQDHPWMGENLMEVHGCIPPEFQPYKYKGDVSTQITELPDFHNVKHEYVWSEENQWWEDQWYTEEFNTDDVIYHFRVSNHLGPNSEWEHRSFSWIPSEPKPTGFYRWHQQSGSWIPFPPCDHITFDEYVQRWYPTDTFHDAYPNSYWDFNEHRRKPLAS
jgi:hypothetical protein